MYINFHRYYFSLYKNKMKLFIDLHDGNKIICPKIYYIY